MATSLATPVSSERLEREGYRRERGYAALLVSGLSLLALLVHGYHPYAEDGGLYVPEIKRLLDPTLYPVGAEFVVGHLHYSLFARMIAGMVRKSHFELETVLLTVHLATIWVTLFAAWLLMARSYASREARAGGVTLLAVWLTMPVAGTSLMLMDPYVTARSVSTPLVLLALVGVLEFMLPRVGGGRRVWGLMLCCGALVGAAVMHPLMAAYGLAAVLMLGVLVSRTRLVRVGGALGLGLAGVVAAAGLQLSAPLESTEYQRVALTRCYWFLSQWQWYELIGLAAPLVIVSFVALGRRREGDTARVGLARMAVAVGATALVVAMLFARSREATHLVARLQPLREFQVVYVVMILVVGAFLGDWVLRLRVWRWITVFSLLAGVMVWSERSTFPVSRHLELPGRMIGSGWAEAFLWVSRNTPKDALFALDAEYITARGEDAQGFRAIAERSSLPDYSKDGGVVAIRPELTGAWLRGEEAQEGLSVEGDDARASALRPLGVTWVVLTRSATTQFVCPYVNDAVKVCRLP